MQAILSWSITSLAFHSTTQHDKPDHIELELLTHLANILFETASQGCSPNRDGGVITGPNGSLEDSLLGSHVFVVNSKDNTIQRQSPLCIPKDQLRVGDAELVDPSCSTYPYEQIVLLSPKQETRLTRVTSREDFLKQTERLGWVIPKVGKE